MTTRPWRVCRPVGPVPGMSFDVDEGLPPPKPAHVDTPWGERFDQYSDGYFRVRPGDRPLGLAALLDRIERFGTRWTTVADGVCCHPHGDRVAILWRNRDGSYRAGHIAATGELDGVWLTDRVSLLAAWNRAELWWLGRGPARPGQVSPAALRARLGLSDA